MTYESKVMSWFLGPKAENAHLLEELITDVLRDHVFWRRNLHTEDGAVISEGAKRTEPFEASMAKLRQELYEFLAKLKKEVPLFSPRYCAHMASEQLLPAIVAYFATMLYNPNNVSAEASSVTTYLELDVGRQLARMAGYRPEAAFGHLCSGGSVANVEALWVTRNLKYLPLAARRAAHDLGLGEALLVRPAGALERTIASAALWELFNVPTDEAAELRHRLIDRYVDVWLGGERSADNLARAGRAVDSALNRYSVQSQGLAGIHRWLAERGDQSVRAPVVLVPNTKHYSWVKAVEALGLGRASLRPIALGEGLGAEPGAVEAIVAECLSEFRPVLMAVGVLSSTELGVVDPIDELCRLRVRAEDRGLTWHTHVDAAWGGYLLATLYDPAGNLRSFADMAEQAWPDERVYRAMVAVRDTDSITIDPHKLGYIPYPAGAVVYRNGRVRDIIVTEAPYAFHDVDTDKGQHISIGKYTLEGSKPGAAAAAVWFAHRILGLHSEGYGQLAVDTCRNAQRFHDRLSELRDAEADFDVVPLQAPECNLVGYVVNRRGNRSLAEMNQVNGRIYEHMSVHSIGAQAEPQFIIAKTHLHHDAYGERLAPFLKRLGIDERVFRRRTESFPHQGATEPVPAPEDERDDEHIDEMVVLRSTFMNPWFHRSPAGENHYLDLMIEQLLAAARRVVRKIRRERLLAAYYRDPLIRVHGL